MSMGLQSLYPQLADRYYTRTRPTNGTGQPPNAQIFKNGVSLRIRCHLFCVAREVDSGRACHHHLPPSVPLFPCSPVALFSLTRRQTSTFHLAAACLACGPQSQNRCCGIATRGGTSSAVSPSSRHGAGSAGVLRRLALPGSQQHGYHAQPLALRQFQRPASSARPLLDD